MFGVVRPVSLSRFPLVRAERCQSEVPVATLVWVYLYGRGEIGFDDSNLNWTRSAYLLSYRFGAFFALAEGIRLRLSEAALLSM